MTAQHQKKSSSNKEGTLVVGLGASAGGLDALKSFFKSMPQHTGMAFIVIVHLAPDHQSNLAELLQMQTSLEVLQVNEKVDIEPEHVYVIPPDRQLKVGDNHLELSKQKRKKGLATIDLFFQSLAETKGERAACIILSGTGKDGTAGLKAVNKKGGLTIVQDPEEAQYQGMPTSAIESGLADLILPVDEMAAELIDYKESRSKISISDEKEETQKVLQKIFSKVHSHTGHDFSNYKQSSVLRRIKRRMQVNRITELPEYLSYLQDYPNEADELFKDLLISVTSFFRDNQAFDALEEKIIPKLFENKQPDDQVRVWVPGCATGEEAYSIAMLLYDYAQQLDQPPEMKIFATDIDKKALDTARAARYPESNVAKVSKKRLHRHFNHVVTEYEVKEEVRKLILFAPHDLLRDPPFSNLDLVACRNLLIYLNRKLQAEVFNLFHYTLRDNGYLFLGLSDSNLEATDLFSPVDKKLRIYRPSSTSHADRQLPQTPLHYGLGQSPADYGTERSTRKRSNFEALHRKLLTRLYAPQSVIINGNFQVIHATDDIQKFLAYSGGEPSHDILEMVRPEIRQPLQSLLFQSREEQSQPLQKKVQFVKDGDTHHIEIVIHPIRETNFSDGLIQVVFKEIPQLDEVADQDKKSKPQDQLEEENEIVQSLEDELEYTRERLQVTVEEYETSNEELRASNEELQSMNEELQSTTEELETSQEELQSVNEELKTVNQQLEGKVDKLDRANSDLKNLMEATEIGIIFVNRDYCVERFTSAATKIFNLIPSDKGRPLQHVTHNLDYRNLLDDIKEVLAKLEAIKKVVSGKEGRSFIMRMRPYRSTEDKIEGVVLTFVEFTKLKKAQIELKEKARQEVLATLGLYVLEQHDLSSILKRAIDLSCIILDLECAVILAFNEQEDTFEIAEQAGCAAEKGPIAIEDKWDIGYALKNEGPTVVKSYKEDERFKLNPFLKDKDIESSAHIVVQGSEKSYGLLSFYSRDLYAFTEDKLNFIQVVGHMVGMAMERDLAEKTLKGKNNELHKEMKRSRQFQREILSNSVAERWELGGYLHDNLAQLLASAKITINELAKKLAESNAEDVSSPIAELNEIIDEGISGIRNLTHDIIPVDIEKEGVAHAFRFLMQQTQKLHNVECILEMDAVINEVTNRKLATNLYHNVQEAIKNAALHGQADTINVSIKKEKDNLIVQIKDNGVGLSNASDENNGRGLRIMEHRMELLGGAFDIQERSGSGESGTIITFTVPLESLRQAESHKTQ